jgi:hypothetical protein
MHFVILYQFRSTHNKVFKADKNFVTKVALRAFAAPQLLRQFCPLAEPFLRFKTLVMWKPALWRF